MKFRFFLCLSACLLVVGCTDTTNPVAPINSAAAQRSPNNPADLRSTAAFGGPAPGQGPGLIGAGGPLISGRVLPCSANTLHGRGRGQKRVEAVGNHG